MLKTVPHPCKRDVNMFWMGSWRFLGGLGAVFNEKSEKSLKKQRKSMKVDKNRYEIDVFRSHGVPDTASDE